MTAGSGLVHSEMPGERFAREGGRLHGFQLWINLPRKDKMISPRYQDTAAERIPVAHSDDGSATVKVIAGESLGTKGVIETRIPILYLHVTLQPGSGFTQAVPRTRKRVRLRDRWGRRVRRKPRLPIPGRRVRPQLRRGPYREPLAKRPLSFLLIAGEPIGEPVARYGPFVMNSREEVMQAVDDYREGKMGILD